VALAELAGLVGLVGLVGLLEREEWGLSPSEMTWSNRDGAFVEG
jgi:hypothetical protein